MNSEKKAQSVIVINTTNIYKMSNHLLTELAEQNKTTRTYDVGNPGTGLGQTQTCLHKLNMSHDYSVTY